MSRVFEKINKLFRKNKPAIKTATPPSTIQEQHNLDKKLVLSLSKQRFPTWEQLQYVSKYLSAKERIFIRVLVGVTIVCLIFLGVRFYQRHVVYLPKEGGTYTEALVGQPSYVNPVLAQTNDVDMDISHLVFSGLFKYDKNQQLIPDLAASYEISEDQKTYTIHLKPNVSWHNGNALLADDVIFTIETIQDSDFKSPLYSSFRGVTIERVDDATIKLVLEEPFTPFLSNLTFGILPAHLWSDVSATNFMLAEYNTKPIGSGPLVFEELTKDRSGNIKTYTLVRNEDYYGQKSYLEKLIFKFYPDFESAVEAVKNKSVDGISFVPNDLKENISENKDLVYYTLQLPQYTAVFFNQKNSLLKNSEIKQALALAVNKKKILTEALAEEGIIIDAPILEGFTGYHPEIKKYEFNKQKAGEMLDNLDWKIPEEGGLRKKGDEELRFSLTTVDRPEYLKTANILKESWETIGVGIELKIMNSARVDKEVIKPRNYETFLYGEILGFDPDPYPFWHSSQILSGGLNLSNYYNKEVDKLLEEGRKINNQDERAQKYIDFQNIIAEELPALFLYSPYYNYAVNEKVRGIELKRITIPSDRFNGIEDWYTKTSLGWE